MSSDALAESSDSSNDDDNDLVVTGVSTEIEVLTLQSESSELTPGQSADFVADLASSLGGLEELAQRLSLKPSKKVLDSLTLDGIVDYINKNGCKNIITMAGAGISTSAGIPDFRSAGTGLYHNLQKYNLPYPEAIFQLDFFWQNPKPFFVLAKELYPGSFKPTPCHYFIKMLHDKGLLLRHYTQNIDTLERAAGIPEEKLVEAHGTFYTGHCLECRAKYELAWMKERIFKDEIPICEKCPGVVKPDIVFFGENLPERFSDCVEEDFPRCDLLIILGTSLVVYPFAGLIQLPPFSTPRLLINRESNGFDRLENDSRDVSWLGDCDEGCQLLAEKLGWGDELKELIKAEHERIDKESTKQVEDKCDRKDGALDKMKKDSKEKDKLELDELIETERDKIEKLKIGQKSKPQTSKNSAEEKHTKDK